MPKGGIAPCNLNLGCRSKYQLHTLVNLPCVKEPHVRLNIIEYQVIVHAGCSGGKRTDFRIVTNVTQVQYG